MKGVFFFLFAAAGLSLSGLEIAEGSLKLVLHERQGAFSLFVLDSEGEERAWLDSRDPSSTFFTLLLNDRIYRPAADLAFVRWIQIIPGGAEFQWRHPQAEVSLAFEFLGSAPDRGADGCRLTLKVTNSLSRPLSAELRFLLDTRLGEDSGFPFVLPGTGPLNHELEITRDLPEFFSSGPPEAPGSLIVRLEGPEPARLVMANWKRLAETPWRFSVRPRRNFSYPPYSRNDGAAALYYDLSPLGAGETAQVSFILGGAGFGEAYDPAAFVPPAPLEASALDRSEIAERMRRDLALVDQLLAELDVLLTGEEEPEPGRVEFLRQNIEDLYQRILGYQRALSL
ncbi:MAG: hypothetical protein LBQ61_03520 [Spirochaetales bacterium]|jgi:hypothetical protein|nr:hypothetical protein [Spirochaetales bacterium]